MHRLRRMPPDEQLRELRTAMRRLLWKMLCVITPGRFYILLGNRKRVTRIFKLTRANENSCRKNIVKKFETLIIKHIMPNMNYITQTKVGTK
jgi:hypothetical protein